MSETNGHMAEAGLTQQQLQTFSSLIGTDKGALLVRNSWGTGWGVGDYGWMSYKYVMNGVTNDHWTMIDASWVNPGVFE